MPARNRFHAARKKAARLTRELRGGPARRTRAARKSRKATTIDAYLSGLGDEQRKVLEKLRRTITKIVPDAEECISYAMPAFRVGGSVIAGFAATAKGCSYYPFSGSTLGTLGDDLRGYSRTKSALHFNDDKPLPSGLVRKLVQARFAEIECRRVGK